MAYTYQADVWCDECGKSIIADITAQGKAPEDPDDESSYDSGDFPKRYDAENSESDSPENCADGECGGTYTRNGREITYGTFLENRLTQDGYEYLKIMLDTYTPSTIIPPAREWAEFYQFTYKGWTSPEMED